jgi:hypothetical protein
MELQTARGIGEIPTSRDQGGGHDRVKEHSAMNSEEGLRIYSLPGGSAYYTPGLVLCFDRAGLKVDVLQKYRMKGRSSRTPSYMTPKAVRTFSIVPEMDWTRCFGSYQPLIS